MGKSTMTEFVRSKPINYSRRVENSQKKGKWELTTYILQF